MPFALPGLPRRTTRRAFTTGVGAAAGLTALAAAPRALAAALPGDLAAPAAAAAQPIAAAATVGGLTLLPPGEAPYDGAGRRDLALDALSFFVKLQGRFPGRTVYQLPVAPWFGGYDAPAASRGFDMAVPSGVPLYLLADADESGALDASRTTVTVNGAAISDLGAYVHGGVSALSYGQVRSFAVLDFVFAPPFAGRFRIEVRTQLPVPVPPGGAVAVSTARSTMATVITYDVSVQDVDSIGPAFYREPATGALYAFTGSQRRYVPDPETLRYLSQARQPVLDASPGFLAATPEGPPLPVLREGMYLQSPDGLVYRLQDGRRVWMRDATGGAPVEKAVLYSILPALQDDMLIRSALPDIFHVNRASLRKIPDWKWATDRGLSPDYQHYVPAWLIAQLPQNSPEWVMPGGTFTDRTFYSDALGRTMPYRVYLPARYDDLDKAGLRYPVVYLLHGLSGRYDEWSGYGAEMVANDLIPGGKFGDAIVVAPQGAFGYWMNQDGGLAWADYVADDFVDHVDQTYRTIPKREARAIGGLSMGAHGAVQLALNYPGVFGVVGSHSPSIRDVAAAPTFFGGEAGMRVRDPITLVRNSTMTNPPLIYLDAGEKDFWRPSAEALHKALVDKGWAHEWHIFPGEHDGWYWGDHLWDYLAFYWTAFQKGGVPVTRTIP